MLTTPTSVPQRTRCARRMSGTIVSQHKSMEASSGDCKYAHGRYNINEYIMLGQVYIAKLLLSISTFRTDTCECTIGSIWNYNSRPNNTLRSERTTFPKLKQNRSVWDIYHGGNHADRKRFQECGKTREKKEKRPVELNERELDKLMCGNRNLPRMLMTRLRMAAVESQLNI